MKPTKFYSKYGEDKALLDRVGELPDNGFYLDIGCAKPHQNSNTAILRDAGWSGLVIDANPLFRPEWGGIPNVIFETAILASVPEVPFHFCPENSWISRIKEGSPLVDAQLLSNILHRNDVAKIDFVSVDIEGAEYDVMKDFPWERYRPKFVIAEYNTLDIGEDYRLMHLLVGLGYKVVHNTIANFVYLQD